MSTSLIRRKAPQEHTLTYRDIRKQKITCALEKARYAVGTVMVGSMFSGALGVIGSIIGVLTSPAGIVRNFETTKDVFQTWSATMMIGGIVLSAVSYLLLEQREYGTTYSKLSEFLWRRKLRKENRVLGWRPREGTPRLSKDGPTYPQYIVEKTVSNYSYGSDELAYYLCLRKYHFNGSAWYPDGTVEEVSVKIGDEEKLVHELERLRTQADKLNAQALEDYYASLEDDKAQAQREAEARQLQEQKDALREQQRLAAKELLAKL